MPKFTASQRAFIKQTVAALSLKRMTEQEIIDEINNKIGKTLTKSGLFHVKQMIKKEAYDWYDFLRKNQYEYVWEFKERINEILSLQKEHYQIVASTSNLQIKQASLVELHKLSITLSNLFNVAPYITSTNNNDFAISTVSETKTSSTETEPAISYVV